jgi:hypothetical protein
MPKEYNPSEPQGAIMDPPIRLTLDVWLLYKQLKAHPDETMPEFVRRITLDYFREREVTVKIGTET